MRLGTGGDVATQRFLARERAYISFLQRVDSALARRLRFCVSPPRGSTPAHASLLSIPSVVRFLETTRQLADLHALYADKVVASCSQPLRSGEENDEDASGERAVGIVKDLLRVVRGLYAQLQSHEHHASQAMTSALTQNSPEALVLRGFLEEHALTVSSLVARPLERIVAIADAIRGPGRADDDGDGNEGDEHEEVDNIRGFLKRMRRQEEREAHLVALQHRLGGVQPAVDLCQNALLFEGTATVGALDQVRPEMTVLCLEDGTLLFCQEQEEDRGEGEEGEEGEQPPRSEIRYFWQLRRDAVFLEAIPRLRSHSKSSSTSESTVTMTVVGAETSFALVTSSASITVTLREPGPCAALMEVITTHLEENDVRGAVLDTQRSTEALPLPLMLRQHPQREALTAVGFPGFLDDPVPGLFWMLDEANADAMGDVCMKWKLVELVAMEHWLLVYAVTGWKQHALLEAVDLTRPEAAITEMTHGLEEWALVVTTTNGAASSLGMDMEEGLPRRLEFVTQRRSRIDFWYDQVTRVLEAAASERRRQQEEKEKEEEEKKNKEKQRQAEQSEMKGMEREDVESAVPPAATEEQELITATEGESPFIDARATKRRKRSSADSVMAALVGSSDDDEGDDHSAQGVGHTEPFPDTPMETTLVVSDSDDEGEGTKDLPETEPFPDTPIAEMETEPLPETTPADSVQPASESDHPHGSKRTTPSRKRKAAAAASSTSPSTVSPARTGRGTTKVKPNDEEEEDAEALPRAIKKLRSPPPMKTPKQRWVRRKSNDPDDDALVATQPTEEGHAEEEQEEASFPVKPSSSTRDTEENQAREIRIVFTGLEPTPKIRKRISAIPGAVYEEDVARATHVIAPKNQLKRTVKLLCGISLCDHILDERWLEESARVGQAVYERQYCLEDSKAQAKWQFDLRQTMYATTRDARSQLFQGHRVFLTKHKSILPPVPDLVKIIECAGGTVVSEGMPTRSDLVVTSEAALGTAAVKKQVASADPDRVYSTELVLSGILRQQLDLSEHRVAVTSASAGGSARARRKRGA